MTAKERPILFSAAMVRALLDGRKMQTRRVMKPQPSGLSGDTGTWYPDDKHGVPYANVGQFRRGVVEDCPYGRPGDRLWVRESHMSLDNRDGGRIITYKAGGPDFVFSAGAGDDDWRGNSKWTPSIHMRREYSRILLEIKNIRMERLRDISEADAIAEGTTPSLIGGDLEHLKYRAGFMTLWDSINAARGFGWDANHWVWVVEFKRIS